MQRQNTTTNYYAPPTIHALSARDAIDNAYRAAGIESPSSVDAISQLLAAEPEPHEVAATYARKSINGDGEAHKLTEEAIAAWQRAQAVESFRVTYDRIVDAVANERISELRAAAVKALEKSFAALVKRLSKAAQNLDTSKPLDRGISFEQDTSAHLKEAQACLSTLSHYAITTEPTLIGVAVKLLPIISIPDVEQELITRSSMGDVFTSPSDEHSRTRNAVRSMLRAAEQDLDTTLINIARGKWTNITFALADDDEMQRRATAHHNATVRKHIKDRNLDNLIRVI